MEGRPKITITIDHPEIDLQISNAQGKLIDSESWRDQNDMSKKLLAAIDTLLEKNKMVIADVGKIEVRSDQRSYTSTRIAKTVAKTVGYCLT